MNPKFKILLNRLVWAAEKFREVVPEFKIVVSEENVLETKYAQDLARRLKAEFNFSFVPNAYREKTVSVKFYGFGEIFQVSAVKQHRPREK